MTSVSIAACIVVLWSRVAGAWGSTLVRWAKTVSPSARLAGACALGIVPLFVAQLVLLWLQLWYETSAAVHQLQVLPLPVFDGRMPRVLHPYFSSIAFDLGLLQTYALAMIVIAIRRGSVTSRALHLRWVVVALALLSLAAPCMSSTDPYEYVATGLLGFRAYLPPAGAFAGTIYEPWQGLIPLRGVLYGPLWVAVDIAQTWFGTSLYQKIEAIRLCNVGFLGLLLWLLGRAGVNRSTIAAFAVCPAIWLFSVVTPHAEIDGLLFIVAAYIFARRSNARLAALCLIAAGLIKLPFVVIGGAALAPLSGSRTRFFYWSTAVLAVAALSLLVPGYISALIGYGVGRAVKPRNDFDEWVVLAPLATIFIILLVDKRRTFLGAAWLFSQIAPLAASWYLLWGFPYALVAGGADIFIISMPVANVMLDYNSYVPEQSALLVLLLASACAFDAYFGWRMRKRPLRLNPAELT